VLAKTLLILWILMNLYVLIRVGKEARQEILWSLGIVKRRERKEDKGKVMKVLDDNKTIKPPKPIKKKDLFKQCKKNGNKCDGGYGCEFSQGQKVEECDFCECLGCTRAICLPALGDKEKC